MSKSTCKYHPAAPSVWRCDSCRIEFCPDCVPGSTENHEDGFPRCALCNERLRCLGAANIAEPFWKRAHWFFAYPLKKTGLGLLGLVGLVAAILPANLIGVIGAILLFGFTIHYSLKVIDTVRRGRMEPPSVREVFAEKGENLFLKLIGMFILMGLFVAAAGFLGSVAAIAMLVFVTLAIPAATMLLAVTHSVTESIHPARQFVLMMTIGPSYLLLWFCLMVVASGPSVVMPVLADALPSAVLFPATMIVSTYFTVATYAMMGYILYEKQADLGFASEDDFGETLEFRQYRVEKGLADAKILAAEGRYEQALRTLEDAVDHDRDDARLRDYYYRIVSATNDQAAIERNTRSICEFYIGRKQPARAAHYCEQTSSRYPQFLLKSGEDTFEVARAWYEQGKFKPAARFLLALSKIAPDFDRMISAHILMARIMFEGFNQDEKARAVLEKIRKDYPDHPEIDEVERLLDVLDRGATPA